MKAFMDEGFLLSNDTAKKLYWDYAAKMPIIDYHCHINPCEIAKDIKFDNITQVWLKGDHYKWRYMRSCGVNEKYITGDASDKEKFLSWASCIEKAIGNPLYHWSHLELRKYFGYQGNLCKKTAEEVWNLCNEKLQQTSVKGLIRDSNVSCICTTDDPIDSLEWHKIIKEDLNFHTKVLPAWRPDKIVHIEHEDYNDYISKLEDVSGIQITDIDSLKNAIITRLDYFESLGCSVSDHALEYIMYQRATEKELNEIFQNRRKNQDLSQTEILQFQTEILLFLGSEYANRNWVMQIHFGCKRDNNKAMYEKLGPDTGFDCIDTYSSVSQMTKFLDALQVKNQLPKTILYSLNPNDDAMIDTILGCFQDDSAVAKIQHGSAWWFNDHKTGMRNQLTSLANLGNLSGFVGMLTDSRSFLSYTRHEYFRRILCDWIGELVENGEFPNEEEILKTIVEDISFYNANRYFEFQL